MALDSVFSLAMDGPEFEIDDLAEVRQLSGFQFEMKRRLRRRARADGIPSSSNCIKLLEVAFSGQTHINFGDFCGLSAQSILQAATRILRDNHVRSIDLSNLTQLSEADITGILDAASSLKGIYLMNMPQVSSAFAFSCWDSADYCPNEIFHSDLLRQPFTHGSIPIKHILLTRVFTDDANPLLREGGGASVNWESYKFTPGLNSKEEVHVGQMDQMVFPLHDINLHPIKLVTGLKKFFDCVSLDKGEAQGFSNTIRLGSIIATSFATGVSSTKISQLPGTLFKLIDSMEGGNRIRLYWPVPFPLLKPGEWAVVIINEHQRNAVKAQPEQSGENGVVMAPTLQSEQPQSQNYKEYRLAVITPRTSDTHTDYRIESMETFLKEVMGKELGMDALDITRSIDHWQGLMGIVGECATEHIINLIPVLERNCETMERSEEMRSIMEGELEWEDKGKNQIYVTSDSDEDYDGPP
ncbi:MAG: hypothetical protein Q9220_007351 [cf. Caloplaca sp. 1 TL-2023]